MSAAGPAADLVVGAVFSLACLLQRAGIACATSASSSRSARYVGACFNLNPFLDRDGYQILVDVLREPNLRTARPAPWRRRRLARARPLLARSAFALVAAWRPCSWSP